jgi:hypothetical protein
MEFSENSRVWVYQSDRALTDDETRQIQSQLDRFAKAWTAHNQKLMAMADVRYNRFLILAVDESQAGASGCSIDKSVHFMKQLEQQYGINLFDRFNFAYREGETIRSASKAEFESLIASGEVNLDTVVYNNLVQNLKELDTKWEVAFKDSWHVHLFGDLVKVS